ncbi:Hypothetical predicted protein [Paramuricea clavata]|uniref:Uncharacterized protein n=1 Tax=Paramuricea clavata TaxID=317549 RepID=A0A6S7H034_PARCT|nr:Hypothetical predicted protein [Paramuricea clavata]
MDEESECADHCRCFALSDISDKDFQKQCSHSSHHISCERCNELRLVVDEVEACIKNHSSNLYSEEQRDDLLYDFNTSKTKIFAWKCHIMRGVNQEQAKQDAIPIQDVSDRSGIAVECYDFSEPQQGKDVCDRVLCPMKASIRRYCAEWNDILNASDMGKALEERPVKRTTAAVCTLD